MIQNHVDLLSGQVNAVPTRSTATAADAALIIRDMRVRSGDGFPDVLVVDHDPKFTSDVFRGFVKHTGSYLIAGYHKNTKAKVGRAKGVIGDTLRAFAFANGRKDDWDQQLPLTVFAINNAASTLGSDLAPIVIDRGAHPRLPLSPPPDGRSAAESPAADSGDGGELLAAAQAERKAKLDTGRVDTVFQVGDQVLLRTKRLLVAADIGKLRPGWDGPVTVTACPGPNTYTLALRRRMLQPDSQRGAPEALLPSPSRTVPWAGIRRWAGGRARGGDAAQPAHGAGRHAQSGAVAQPHLRGRRVAAAGGVWALSR